MRKVDESGWCGSVSLSLSRTSMIQEVEWDSGA